MIKRFRAFGSCVAIAVFLMWGLGCSDPPQENQPVINQWDDDPDDGDDDGDGDGEVDPCEGVRCGTGEICFEGACQIAADEGFSCANPFDMGTLSGDGVLTWEADPVGQPNMLNTTCAADNRSTQAIFAFQVENPMRLRAQFEFREQVLVKELRKSSCSSAGAVEWCTINPREWIAEPGVQYYLIVEANEGGHTESGSGQFSYFQLQLETEELVCHPPAGTWCDGDNRVLCFAGNEERVRECPAGCAEGECLPPPGDTCDDPIIITESSVVSAVLTDFSSAFDFADSPDCTSPAHGGRSTPGQDLVFGLPGLQQGQVVDIAAPNSAFVIAVMDSCDATAPSCVAGEDSTGTLSWTVPADGDYFVAISRLLSSSSTNPVEYTFTID